MIFFANDLRIYPAVRISGTMKYFGLLHPPTYSSFGGLQPSLKSLCLILDVSIGQKRNTVNIKALGPVIVLGTSVLV